MVLQQFCSSGDYNYNLIRQVLAHRQVVLSAKWNANGSIILLNTRPGSRSLPSLEPTAVQEKAFRSSQQGSPDFALRNLILASRLTLTAKAAAVLVRASVEEMCGLPPPAVLTAKRPSLPAAAPSRSRSFSRDRRQICPCPMLKSCLGAFILPLSSGHLQALLKTWSENCISRLLLWVTFSSLCYGSMDVHPFSDADEVGAQRMVSWLSVDYFGDINHVERNAGIVVTLHMRSRCFSEANSLDIIGLFDGHFAFTTKESPFLIFTDEPAAWILRKLQDAACANACLMHRALDARLLRWANSDFLASGGEDHRVYVWHRRHRRLIRRLCGHTEPVNAVSWNGNGLLASASDDKQIIIWSTGAGSRADCDC
ncbi:unnamed protein product [Polarella glacialis]|uniref:Protein HIRA n=1 Tax=Polarella glacialis TaxID=89957 RepID=A0A813EEQ8_POLGL|nr:unnamed protein product [Polarella glacialis]